MLVLGRQSQQGCVLLWIKPALLRRPCPGSVDAGHHLSVGRSQRKAPRCLGKDLVTQENTQWQRLTQDPCNKTAASAN
jgi:hypothetical protein